MGKGKKPLYSWWDGEKLDYITARKRIYVPLYSTAVRDTKAFKRLKELYEQEEAIYLLDFDGYNHKLIGMTYDMVLDNPYQKCGHAFVLGMMLEGLL